MVGTKRCDVMNHIVGSVKHVHKDRVEPWVYSAIKNTNAQINLLVLDEQLKEEFLDFENYGVNVVHMPTKNSENVHICKYERHLKARDFLKTLQPDDNCVLTDTLDLVFQKDPFEWISKNANKDLILTSESISHFNEHWNMRSVLGDFPEFSEEIKPYDVINSGVCLGKVKEVKDILMLMYLAKKGLNPENTEQPALNVILISDIIRRNVQFADSTTNLILHCAVGGPTQQWVDWGFYKNYTGAIPKINEDDVIVREDNDEPFYMVHQYNRVNGWEDKFKKKYTNYLLTRKKKFTNKTATVVCRKNVSYYESDWEKTLLFDNDDYVLMDLSEGNPQNLNHILKYVADNVVSFNETFLRQILNFSGQASSKHWWNNGGNRNIIWFYPHFRMLYFYLTQPDYDYYWFFDEDVTFPQNNLKEFIKAHSELDHDCMITYLFSNFDNENNSNVPVIDENMVSYHSRDHYWLKHYPGDGDKQPEDVTETYGSYFPLVRLSNEAMRILWQEHQNGYYGYSEGYVPSILNKHGLKLYSIYNKDSKVVADENLVVYHRRYLELQWKNL
jgi:hypothetical protein